MTTIRVVLDDLAFPESPRWHDGHVYVSDWGAHEVIAVTDDGGREVVARGTAFPLCFDFLPDGRLLLVDGTRLLVQEQGGDLATYADLSGISPLAFNDITVDRTGNVFVNCIDFEFPGGEPRPGLVAVVPPNRRARKAAGGVMFPNGMVTLGRTLVVAESYANRLTAFDIADDGSLTGRREWAAVDGPPDGLCVAPDGAIWYADVPHRCCVRVAEGGKVQERIDLDRGAFSCAWGDDTLFVATNEWGDDGPEENARNGQLVAIQP
jgi:sugar lactone lactonase YvrE